MRESYQFTNNWFEPAAKIVWDTLIPNLKPTRILEIGCYEGAASCYLIEKLGSHQYIEIHCVDTWEGSIENKALGTDMSDVEQRFKHNIKVAQSRFSNDALVSVNKGRSDSILANMLLCDYAGYFDFIYVDGSHQAPDVLCDAVLAFRLLRVGGIMAFDDYLWSENLPYGVDPVRCPKMAIDAFTNIYCRQVRILQQPLYQLYIQKIAN